jgi:hypothetical protein
VEGIDVSMRSGAGATGGLTGAAARDDSAVAVTEDAPLAPEERWTRAILLMTRPLKSGTASASFTTSSQTAEARARVRSRRPRHQALDLGARSVPYVPSNAVLKRKWNSPGSGNAWHSSSTHSNISACGIGREGATLQAKESERERERE